MPAVSAAHQQTADAQLEVLWAGNDARAREALERLGIRVTRVHPEQCLQQVARRAPDLLVFSGSAAAEADAIVRELRAMQPGATLAVIVISGDVSPTAEQRSGGLMARISSELTPSAVAAEIHERSRAVAALSRLREVAVSSRDIDAWLRSALEAQSSGFLLASAGAIALGPSGRVAPSPELMREALAQSHGGEPAALKFLELPPNRLLVLSAASGAAAPVDFAGAQLVVVHPDLERREALCAELIGAGALAQAVGVEPDEIARVAGFAPALVVIAAAALQHPSTTSLWQDARLASASWLVLDESEHAALAPGQILGPAAALSAAGQALRRRLAEGELVVDRVESFGAAGWLRELGRCERPLTLLFKGASGRSELSLAGGKIRGAAFFSVSGGAPQTGQAALQASLAMPFGRVLVGPHELVTTYEASLQADQELAPSERSEEPTPSHRSEEPAPSEIRQRRGAARAVEPSSVSGTSFRPSKPAQFSTKTESPAAPGRLLAIKAAGLARTPAAARPSRAPAAPDVRSAEPSPAPAPGAAREDSPPPAPISSPTLRPAGEEQSPPPAPIPSPTPHAAREEQTPPPAPIPSLTPRPAREEQTPPPAPIPSPTPRATREDQSPPPPAQRPQSAAFDVVLAQGLLGPTSVRPRVPSSPERVAEASPARASVPHAAGTPPAPPPLPRAAPAEVVRLVPERVSAPIAPIASELEPTPAPPALPEQSEARAHSHRRSYGALVFFASAAIGVALVTIAGPRAVRHETGAPDLPPAARAAGVGPSSEVQPRPKAQAALAQAAAPREPAAPRSEPAHGKLRPSAIPRGSEDAELLQRAKQARDDSRPRESEALLSEVLARYPDDFGARYHMALTLVRLRRFDEAHAQLSKAMELNRESASAWLLEGDIFIQEGRRREAVRAWNRCLEVQADFATCRERLARWRMR